LLPKPQNPSVEGLKFIKLFKQSMIIQNSVTSSQKKNRTK